STDQELSEGLSNQYFPLLCFFLYGFYLIDKVYHRSHGLKSTRFRTGLTGKNEQWSGRLSMHAWGKHG
ncbi:MAG: hypothetical protein WAX03_07035, partial [Trichococcus flocculiformis]